MLKLDLKTTFVIFIAFAGVFYVILRPGGISDVEAGRAIIVREMVSSPRM